MPGPYGAPEEVKIEWQDYRPLGNTNLYKYNMHAPAYVHTHTSPRSRIRVSGYKLSGAHGGEKKTSFKETVLPGFHDLELGDFKEAITVEQF